MTWHMKEEERPRVTSPAESDEPNGIERDGAGRIRIWNRNPAELDGAQECLLR